MDIETIQERIRRGNYLVKSHAVQHALKEGFERRHIVEAVLNGIIIEEYPDERRALVCGRTNLEENLSIYLHVIYSIALEKLSRPRRFFTAEFAEIAEKP